MNADRPSPSGTEPYRSLQILDELSNNDSLTQRELSSSLGIALGLVNSYIKNLIKKGYYHCQGNSLQALRILFDTYRLC